MKETEMPQVRQAHLTANSGNTAYWVESVRYLWICEAFVTTKYAMDFFVKKISDIFFGLSRIKIKIQEPKVYLWWLNRDTLALRHG